MVNEKFSKFYKKSVEERLKVIEEVFGEDVAKGLTEPLSLDKADSIIENVVGRGSLPIGVVTNLRLNGKDYIVPMMIEEPSVVAAANRGCKLTLPNGFTGIADESLMLGEILLRADNAQKAYEKFKERSEEVEKIGRELAKPMEQYGGGFERIWAETLYTVRGEFLLVKFLANTADAMGANTINTLAEGMAPYIEDIIEGKSRMRILSNLSTYRKVKVEATFNIEGVEEFLDGVSFAENDIYRRATHNKGAMNGMDAVALATGQDWRAIEAGIHTYSALTGKPITSYHKAKEGVKGVIEVPLAVGSVGGATRVLAHAGASLKMLGNPSAKELAMIIAAVGLANNFSAVNALTTTGIQKGHMKLHARVLAMSLGATTEEAAEVMKRVEGKKVTMDLVKEELEKMRAERRGEA